MIAETNNLMMYTLPFLSDWFVSTGKSVSVASVLAVLICRYDDGYCSSSSVTTFASVLSS